MESMIDNGLPPPVQNDKKKLRFVICSMIFITGFVSFGYEVVMQAEAVIYLGSSNIAMGVVISMFILGYLSSMLFGIWADRLRNTGFLILLFLTIELLVGLIIIFMGDMLAVAPGIAEYLSSLPVLGAVSYYSYLLLIVSILAVIIPALMGGEMPIAMKILTGTLPDAYAEIGKTTGTLFTLDALGSALGGVITSVFLLELLGKSRTALAVGIISLSMVLIFGSVYFSRLGTIRGVRKNRVGRKWTWIPQTVKWLKRHFFRTPLPDSTPKKRPKKIGIVYIFHMMKRYKKGIVWLMVIATIISSIMINLAPIKYGAQQEKFEGVVIYYKETPFNTIAVTEHLELDRTFYQNNKIVYSERDHFQLYEPMVHVPMMQIGSPERVLILGGGNGGALAEALKYPTIREIMVVEKDPEMISVAKMYFSKTQNNAFDNQRVVLNHSFPRDFLTSYIEENDPDDGNDPGDGNDTDDGIPGPGIRDEARFDVVIVDLMEPRDLYMALNYTLEFYQNISRILTNGGVIVTQGSSPIMAPETCVTIRNTMGKGIGFSILFGTDIWSTGPYLLCMGARREKILESPHEAIERNYENLTGTTLLYCPPNHHAFGLNALTNIMMEKMMNETISTDEAPYIERIS